MSVVQFRDVSKAFGKTRALDGVNLDLRPGEVTALLGPNGAGKTTLISILLGDKRADSGTVQVLGGSPGQLTVRAKIAFVPQVITFPPVLTVIEILRLVRAHYHQGTSPEEILQRFDMGSLAQKQAGTLSFGQRRKVALATAFLNRARLLVFDEPTVGLDFQSRRLFWEWTREAAAAGASVLFSTHNLDEVDSYADRVTLLHKGKVISSGSPEEIKREYQYHKVSFFAEAVPDWLSAEKLIIKGRHITVWTRDSDRLVALLVQHKVCFHRLIINSPTLEEAIAARLAKEDPKYEANAQPS